MVEKTANERAISLYLNKWQRNHLADEIGDTSTWHDMSSLPEEDERFCVNETYNCVVAIEWGESGNYLYAFCQRQKMYDGTGYNWTWLLPPLEASKIVAWLKIGNYVA